MSAAVTSALVLAAGLGTRMRPLTNDRPKALVDVAGRALVDHVLDRLAAGGVTRAVVNVHHFADRLEGHLAGRSAPAITISDERGRLLETGGALVKARPHFAQDDVIVTANIDSVWTTDVGARGAIDTLCALWRPEAMDALLLLAATTRSMGYYARGDFTADNMGKLARRRPGRVAPFAYMGVQLIKPSLAEAFAEEPFSMNKIWDRSLAAGRLYGARHDGVWMHVGDPEARAAAEARLARTAPAFA